jgi:hypothetical protein
VSELPLVRYGRREGKRLGWKGGDENFFKNVFEELRASCSTLELNTGNRNNSR